MVRVAILLLFPVGVLCSLACGDDDPIRPTGTVQILTDASQYSKRNLDTIRSILLNNSSETVYLFSCTFHTTIERQASANEWVNLGAWYLVCQGPTYPIPIEPGGFVDLPDLYVPLWGDFTPGFHRVRVDVYSGNKPTDLLPEAQRTSPPFELVL